VAEVKGSLKLSARRNNRILRKLRELQGDDRPTTKRAALEARRHSLLKELDADFFGVSNKVKSAIKGLRNVINKAGLFIDKRYAALMGGDNSDSDIVLFDYGTRLEFYYKQSFVLSMDEHESVTQQLLDVHNIVSEAEVRSALFPNEYTSRPTDMPIQDGELMCYDGGLINTAHGKKMVKKSISDDVKAIVHNGEFVFRHTAVRGIGCGSVHRGAMILYALMDMYSQKDKHYPYLNDEDDEWQFEYNPNDDETE